MMEKTLKTRLMISLDLHRFSPHLPEVFSSWGGGLSTKVAVVHPHPPPLGAKPCRQLAKKAGKSTTSILSYKFTEMICSKGIILG